MFLHANLPLGRRIVSHFIQSALSDAIAGTVVASEDVRISTSQVTVGDLELLDGDGRRVAKLSGVALDLSLTSLALTLLGLGPSGTIVMDHVRAERADVKIVLDPRTGEPTIALALRPRGTASAEPGRPPSAPALGVFLRSFELGRVAVRANLAGQDRVRARLSDVRGRLWALPEKFAVDVDRFGLVVRSSGPGVHGTATLVVRQPGPVQATFQGFLGDVEVSAAASLENGRVALVGDLPGASPAAMSRIVPGWPALDPVAGHFEAKGTLAALHAAVSLGAGASKLKLEGPVTLGASPSATLSIEGTSLDARLVAAGAPETNADVAGTLSVNVAGGSPRIRFIGHVDPSLIASVPAPAVDLDLTAEDGAVKGSADLHEPAAPVTATFTVTPAGVLDLDAKTSGVDLSRVRRIPTRDVHGVARARLHVHVEKQTLRATGDADVTNFAVATTTLSHAHATLDVKGPASDPDRWYGTAHVEGGSGVVNGVAVEQFVANARGTPNGIHFDTRVGESADTELLATGTATLKGIPAIHDVDVTLHRDPVTITGKVASLDANAAHLDIRDVRVAGAGGTLQGSMRVGKDALELNIDGDGVDLDALRHALGLPRGSLSGKARIQATLSSGHATEKGHVTLALTDATVGPVGGVSLDLTADLNDRVLSGKSTGRIDGVGSFGADWDAALPGSIEKLQTFRDMTGTADVHVDGVKLELLNALLPKSSPVEGVGGTASARLLLHRKTAKSPLPDVLANARIDALSLSLPPDGTTERRLAANVTLAGALDGTTGSAQGTTVIDGESARLASATGSIALDLESLLRSPSEALSNLLGRPIELTVSLPKHAIATLPIVGPSLHLNGSVEANVSVRGTLAHPTLFATVKGSEIAPVTSFGGHALDVRADAQYVWDTRSVGGRADVALSGRTIGSATFHGAVPGGLASFAGGARVDLSGLPLDLFQTSEESPMSGALYGALELSRDKSTGTLNGDVRVLNAAVAHVPLGEGRFTLRTTGDVVETSLGFSGAEGTLDVTAEVPVSFADPVPRIGRSAPIAVHAVAHDFAAVALTPLVKGVLTRIGGRFDADVSAALDPTTTNGKEDWTGGLRGTAALRDGSVLIDALGLDVRDLSASLDATGTDAKTTLAIRDVRGRVRSNSDNLHGSAELTLDGLRLSSGHAALQTKALPLLFRGAPQGRATGEVTAQLTRKGELMVVAIDVPKLVVELPQSSTRKVIELTDHPDVSIVQLETGEDRSEEITPWRLEVHLGKEVTLRRSDVELAVSGSPVIELGDETAVNGVLELTPGGRVPVLGKIFFVDHGQVIFDTGDPGNPRLDVTAAWRAPNDTTVYVELTGTLHEAKLALRSDPPLPEPAVFALLLGGGSADDESPTAAPSQNGGAAGAVALGGNVAALGVNQLISNNPVELRVETTSQSLPRYTAAVRVRSNLYFEASEYQQTEVGPSGSSDRHVFSGTVDYRFAHRWSLRTEVGTAGGALDLLWRYRY